MSLNHTPREAPAFHDRILAENNETYGNPDKGIPILAERMLEVVGKAGLDIKTIADDHLKKLVLHSGMYFHRGNVSLWANARALAEFHQANA